MDHELKQPETKHHDRSDEGKGIVLKPEDAKLMEEQKKLGAVMDKHAKHEQFLLRHKDAMLNDDSLLLYRLPLSDEQREAIYNKLIAEKLQ